MKVFKLEILDLTNVGNQGGKSILKDVKYSKDIEKLADFAKEHYKLNKGGSIGLIWKRYQKTLSTGDLGHVMYTIEPIKLLK